MTQRKRFFEKTAHILLVIATALGTYANSFHVPFLFDDESSITGNKVIRSLANFFVNGDGYAYNPRRFVGYLTFALNYRWGGLDVVGYHVVNLAIHIASALLIYALLRLTFRTPVLRNSVLASQSPLLALAAALLFVVHPLQTQAVTYTVQRLASLATCFYLAALVMHVRWRLALEAGARCLSKKTLPCYLTSLAAAVLAMKTKEIAFTLPLVVLLYEVFFFGWPDRKRWLMLAPMLLTALIIPLGMINLQQPVGEVIAEASQATVVKSPLSRWEYLYTQFSVIVTYLRLLALPVNQNLDHDYPVNLSLLELRAFLALLLLTSLLAAGVLLYRRSRRGDNASLRLAAFGIFWFFITLAVESSIIPITDVIYEHRVYLPSVGFMIAVVTLVALGVCRLTKHRRLPARIAFALLTLVVTGLAGTTYARNMVWQSQVSLWQDVQRKSPHKARPNNNLGKALEEIGRFDEAMEMYQRALRIKPDHAESLHNLGRILLLIKGRPDLAEPLFYRAITANPNYVDAYVNLGAACIRLGRYAEAIGLLGRAKVISSDRPDLRFNLGIAYVLIGNMGGAAGELEALYRLDTTFAQQLSDFISKRRAE